MNIIAFNYSPRFFQIFYIIFSVFFKAWDGATIPPAPRAVNIHF